MVSLGLHAQGALQRLVPNKMELTILCNKYKRSQRREKERTVGQKEKLILATQHPSSSVLETNLSGVMTCCRFLPLVRVSLVFALLVQLHFPKALKQFLKMKQAKGNMFLFKIKKGTFAKKQQYVI